MPFYTHLYIKVYYATFYYTISWHAALFYKKNTILQ